MISRANKRRSHRKVGFGRTFLHSVFEASRTMGATNRKVGIGWSLSSSHGRSRTMGA